MIKPAGHAVLWAWLLLLSLAFVNLCFVRAGNGADVAAAAQSKVDSPLGRKGPQADKDKCSKVKNCTPCTKKGCCWDASTGTCIDASAGGTGTCVQDCKNPCAFLNLLNVAQASLDANGACTINACQPDFGDCNNVVSDGCETDLRTSAANCGSCGKTCTAALNDEPGCSNRVCSTALVCKTGFADCNRDATDGCEANLNTDTTCGSCTNNCNPANSEGGRLREGCMQRFHLPSWVCGLRRPFC